MIPNVNPESQKATFEILTFLEPDSMVPSSTFGAGWYPEHSASPSAPENVHLRKAGIRQRAGLIVGHVDQDGQAGTVTLG